MTAGEITRRSLLAATAGAVVGGLVRPGGALAALERSAALGSAAEPIVSERVVGMLPAGGTGVTIDLRRNADLVGVLWSGPLAAHIELRFRGGDGGWSRWVSAGSHGHAPDGAPQPGAMIGDPVWTGGGWVVQLRSDRTLGDVRLSCVDVSDGIGARGQAQAAGPAAPAAALPLATPTLPAGAGQPPIVARHAWAQGMARPRVAPEYGAVQMAFVHHTDNPNGYSPGEVPAMLRAIYAFHRYVNGWNDIGYNFVIDLYGRIFEARAGGIDEPVIGAHAGGYNYVSTGVAVLGEFSSRSISPAAQNALERLLAWKLSLHGTPSEGRVTVRVDPAGAVYSRYPAGARVSLPRIAGHRDGDTTDCPGNALYAELPGMRPRIGALVGRVARASIALGAAPSAPGEPSSPEGHTPPAGEVAPGGPSVPATQAQTLTGSLAFLDGAGGTPIQGAPITIQAREVSDRGEVVRERTIAQASTATNGEWSLPVTVTPAAGGMWLRALCPGASGVPATLSEPMRVPGAVSIAPEPDTTVDQTLGEHVGERATSGNG
jgi:hypothetical protein